MAFIPHSDEDVAAMLEAVGASSVRELYEDIPDRLILDGPLALPDPLSEWEAVRLLREYAALNSSLTSFAGAGIYDHHVPAALDHLTRRSEFYTAYTPYQPEVSQGTLQAVYEFQTMVCELTGMEVANASMYDGASATAEAVLMAMALTRRSRVVLSASLHPHYRKVVETYLTGQEARLDRLPAADRGVVDAAEASRALDEDTACLVVQNPNFFGLLETLPPLAEAAHAAGALLLVVVADAMSLSLVRPPGECGADIVTAEGQAFGNAPSFGGPVVGLFASRARFVRKMPGRIVGATVDVEGRRGYVLTLQTREQQIRREKATSNICTNQGLNALAATIYLALMGRTGLRQVAETAAQNAHYARDRLEERGVRPLHPGVPFFREFAVATPRDSRDVLARGTERGLLAGVSLRRFPESGPDDGLLLAFTEKHRRADIDRLVELVASSA
ncbi:MAG: aminomethyl-transferring glycine dehydrogenase subunit GcvPA [Gemmatimonadota bacterium]